MNDIDRPAHFAGLAMQSLLAAETEAKEQSSRAASNQSIAKQAWDMADAMVEECAARPKSAQEKLDLGQASD